MPATGFWPLATGATFQRVMACLRVHKWFHSSSHLYCAFSELGWSVRWSCPWALAREISYEYQQIQMSQQCPAFDHVTWSLLVDESLIINSTAISEVKWLWTSAFIPTWMRSTCNCFGADGDCLKAPEQLLNGAEVDFFFSTTNRTFRHLEFKLESSWLRVIHCNKIGYQTLVYKNNKCDKILLDCHKVHWMKMLQGRKMQKL